jgi:hypothetical protein
MQWVDRLRDATSWQASRWECDWGAVESALGATLPGDYKELCDIFGPGYFSRYIQVAPGLGQESIVYWRKVNKELFEANPAGQELTFSPYKPCGIDGPNGLLTWGTSETGGYFFWLVDVALDPDRWPIIARYDMSLDQEWDRYEMSLSEFVYRVIADPEFKPYTVARPEQPPTFSRLEELPSDEQRGNEFDTADG